MNLGGLTKPVSDLSQKTAKAQKVKSVKLKIKFGDNNGATAPGKTAVHR